MDINFKRLGVFVVFGLIMTTFYSLNLVYLPESSQINQYSNTLQFLPHKATTNLKIMTTNTIPFDIVSNILGNQEEVESIVDGNTDIHHFQGPTQQQMKDLSEADVLFAMGLEDLEPWLEDTLDSLGSDAPPVVNLVVSSMIRNDPVLDNGPNPHVWLDPNIIKQMADTVYSDLSTRDPTNSATFLTNLNIYKGELDALLTRINEAKADLKGIKVVTIHPAFTYLFDLLEMDQIATIEKIEGQEPSNAYIHEVIELMKKEGCKLVVGQPQIPKEDAYEIAREAGAKVSFPTPFPFVEDQNGDLIESYIEMMDYNLWTLNHPKDPPSENENMITGFEIRAIFFSLVIGIIGIISYRIHNRIKFWK